MPTCEWILHSGPMAPVPTAPVFTQRCPAEADASGFCPVHRAPIEPKPRIRTAVDHDRDLLPWTEADRAAFDASRL
jgi:hypothetical protein